MIYILKFIFIVLLLVVCASFFIARHIIIVRLEKNHIETYRKLFVTVEDNGTEIDETFLWGNFIAEGYKNLNDEYLERVVRQHKALGTTLIGLFIFLMCLLGSEQY